MFLQEVAKDLYTRFGKNISELALVFPNKRPALYIRKWLGEEISGPLWSPELFTIHEFIQRSTSKLSADRLQQSFLLFESYCEIMQQQGEEYTTSFENFFGFGEILLNDFTELESNLAAIEDVYANLYQVEQIEKGFDYLSEEQQQYLKRFWTSFSADHMSRQQEKFIRLWKHLPAIYNRFKEQLSGMGLVNTGTIYRELVNQTNDQKGFIDAYKKIIFIGFNALNQAELKLFQRYKEQGKALFYFDADQHYLEDELQEAGRFMRRNIRLFGNEAPLLNGIKRTDRPVHVITAEGDAAQVRLIPQLLKELPKVSRSTDAVAVLLSDEKQLLPLLHALPDDFPVNITMGYELQQSPVFSMIRSILDIHVSLSKNQHKKTFYQPLVQFLQHPWLQHHPPATEFAQTILTKGMITVHQQQLEELADPFLQNLFTEITSPRQLFDRIKQLLEWWSVHTPVNNQTELQRQLVTAAYLQLNRLEDLLQQYQQYTSVQFVAETIVRVLSSLSVPLEGEPLKGLQVMGLLESRGLDFDRIILLNVNEGVLPKRSAAPSFLPDSIRRAFSLSVLENQDTIFAYVFYRLLQRSSEMWCTYNSIVSDQSTGEKSRFLTQLEHETNIPFLYRSLLLPVNPTPKEPITISKDAGILKTMHRFSMEQSKLSPSAINNYIDCRLKFYFSKIARIREPDEFPEEIDPRTLGLILHKTMEFLYQKLEQTRGNKQVLPEDFKFLQQWLTETELDRAFASEIRKDPGSTIHYNGTYLVVREVLLSYAQAVLEADERYAPFTMVQMEAEVSIPVSFDVHGKKTSIQLGGYIDRIDEKEGVYRIIDYKTGKDSKTIPSVESLFDREKTDRNKAALQTFIYSWVLQRTGNTHRKIETGLYDIRNLKKEKENFDWRFNLKEGRGQQTSITHHLHADIELQVIEKMIPVLQEIFDPAVPFDQTSLVEKCQYCPYKILCGR
jgi:ATP-dependent helicase/nuclease subunit B